MANLLLTDRGIFVECRGTDVTYWRLVSDHFSSRNVVAMVAEATNKLRRQEVARQSQSLWDRGFGLGLRLFKVKMGSLL